MAKRFKAIMTGRPSVERMIKRLKCDLADERLSKRGRVQPVVRARYAASGVLKSESLAAFPEARLRDSRWMRNAVNSSQRPLR
jgi:hypothetical protein